jgi:hypothetical protein
MRGSYDSGRAGSGQNLRRSAEPGVDCLDETEDAFPMEERVMTVGSFEDEPDDLSFWLGKRPEERLAAIEHLRQQFFAYGEARQEFRRFLEVAELPRG